MNEIPVWDTAGLYEGFGSQKWAKDKKALSDTSTRLLRLLRRLSSVSKGDFPGSVTVVLKLFDKAGALAENLTSFAYLCYSVDTRDEIALKELNAVEELSLPLRDAQVRFRRVWGNSSVGTSSVIQKVPELEPYRLLLDEGKVWARYQMPEAEESLASDLLRSGGEAWGRLQEAVSSNLSACWNQETNERKTVVQLRALAADPDRSVRERAWKLELEAWKSVEIPLAAALNGVKGQANTLNQRRGWKKPLDQSSLQSRLSSQALQTMIGAMQESLPSFRRYLKAKARLLKVTRCAFFDLFAPVGDRGPSYTFAEAQNLIETSFSTFSPAMAAFARLAFEKKWIHALPQRGKVGGAYCISLPLAKQPRILSNFDGTFGEIKTLAHELGHGWHFWLLRHKSQAWRDYPMTLAETASIFAETILQNAALDDANESTALFLIDQSLQDSTQVIVDILSRYYFEQKVFDQRNRGELSPREFNEFMLEAQRTTYGDALDSDLLHPYMWAVKGHYYRPGLAFYNYPYAFGQIFGLALYARAKAEGKSFARTYQRLLEGTGILTADRLAQEAGFDLNSPDFWKSGLKEIETTIDQFERRSHEN